MMEVLDSDIIIAYLRGNEKAITKIRNTKEPATTVFNAKEVLIGPWLADSMKHFALTKEFLNGMNIISYDRRSLAENLKLAKDLRKKGTPIGEFDQMIAATCLSNGAKIITRNEKHFSKVKGLEVETW